MRTRKDGKTTAVVINQNADTTLYHWTDVETGQVTKWAACSTDRFEKDYL